MTLALRIIAIIIFGIAGFLGFYILLNKVFHWHQRRWILIPGAVSILINAVSFLLLFLPLDKPYSVAADLISNLLDIINTISILVISIIATEGKWYKRIVVVFSSKAISSILIYEGIASFFIKDVADITDFKSFFIYIGLSVFGLLLICLASLPSRNIKSRKTSALSILLFSIIYEIIDVILDPEFKTLLDDMAIRHTSKFGSIAELLRFTIDSDFLRFFFLVIIPFVALYGINFYMSQRYYKVEAKNNADYLESQAKYYENIKKSNSEIRKLRHDYRNHLTVLSLLIGNGDSEKALEYINDLNGNLLSPTSLCNTGNETSDAIIIDKINKASELGINLIVEGKFIYPDMKPIDICTILGNILDNAIEAVTREHKKNTLQNKDIHLGFIATNNFFMINETNKSLTPLKYDGSVVITSKKDSELHGLGLSNIRTSAEKYGGDVEISCIPSPDVDNEFDYSISIMLPVVKTESNLTTSEKVGAEISK